MNIYLDNIIFYLQKYGGISVYWEELAKRIISNGNVNFIQPNKISDNIFYQNLSLGGVINEQNIPLAILRYLPLTVEIPGDSIFHSSYYRYSNSKDVKNVVTIHDFIYELYGNGISKFVHHEQKKRAVHNSKGIICISNSTRDDLTRFFSNKLKGKNITTIYNGVSECFFYIADKVSLKIGYPEVIESRLILFVGKRSHYKNFRLAVLVIKELPKEYKLAIVGNELNSTEKEFLYKNIPNRYIYFGNVSTNKLNEIYNIAECLIYPSNYEGFGIPIVEAFKCYCPVIAKKCPASEEISGGAAILIDNNNITSFRNEIIQLNMGSNKDYLTTLGYEVSKKYSWEKCYRETFEFYSSL